MNNNKNKGNFPRCAMGKFAREIKSDDMRWQEHLRRYRFTKLVSRLIDKFSLIRLSELTGYSASYISHVEHGAKPGEDFVRAMEDLDATL